MAVPAVDRAYQFVDLVQAVLRHEPKGKTTYTVHTQAPTWFDNAVAREVRRMYRDAGWTQVECSIIHDAPNKPSVRLLLGTEPIWHWIPNLYKST